MPSSAQPRPAGPFDAQRQQLLALGRLTEAPAVQDAAGYKSSQNVKAIFFDALPWKGKPTKVFAWWGLPDDRQGKVPGVVLVHGGGGTAFKGWVTRWNDHGFAAISIAVEGQIDKKDPSALSGVIPTGWKQHAWSGPCRKGIYHDSAEPLEDQWMYHAVADTILANSLLRSLPEVDADKVGLMGISWGGVITSTVVGIDDRFAFAIPVYGCGHLFDAPNHYGRSLGNDQLYKKVWDPMVRLSNAKMPILWFSWPQDLHFPLDCQAASYRAAGGPRMVTLVPRMGHGHGPAWNRKEAYAFAEAIVQSGEPWCRQTESETGERTCRVAFWSQKPIDKAVLVSTTDSGITGRRKWVESAAELQNSGQQWQATARLPAGTTAWFINLASGPLVVSSDFQEIKD
ncbi:MAG: prolyl oligopeptidase family serine peptidase [Planctomycetales bacterium]|nr:prolyl oligopeptidase family serine peptidase [Planctomycetales bacterium]NIM08002.1 prolyl oligopeptidase family serine peptidase [Planctomycetales bacterium]NIN07484.1 prolyl oligopeptidase family serine peptidase [Planctomycetales bacterium]NIN76589.1 prolyl oligopeptidase family serine peptidase [Planctomycetales bacterium]NIO33779.1 prolyl oligopeptidase family serine peptidase [Planctomycetales bacterium]